MPDSPDARPDGNITFSVDHFAPFAASGSISDDAIVTIGAAGYLVYGPYRGVASGRYRVAIYGTLEACGAEAIVDVAHGRGEVEVARLPLRGQAGPGIIAVFTIELPRYVSDLEIRIKVSGGTRLSLQRVELQKRNTSVDYAIVNKSYAADARWSLVLYLSAMRFVQPAVPFYLVIPRHDCDLFLQIFNRARLIGLISQLPIILFEDWVLEETGNCVPESWDGWMVQQVIKLAFSKLGLAQAYLTCDSAQFFTRAFDFSTALFRNGVLCTTARRQNRAAINEHFVETREQCWLQGRLVPAGDAFDAIDAHFGPLAEDKYHYIGCNGIFGSDICGQLEAWAGGAGFANFAGLIAESPYEFAWYGSFVSHHLPEKFMEIDPYLYYPIYDLKNFKNAPKDLRGTPYYGYLFQKPACSQDMDIEIYLAALEG